LNKEKYQFSEDNLAVYQKLNEELELKVEQNPEKKKTLELLKCIQAYRSFPNIADLIKNSPTLINQIEDLRLLWLGFSKMGEEQVSEMAIELIQDLS